MCCCQNMYSAQLIEVVLQLNQMRNMVLSRICTKTHCRWGVQLENKKWHISASTAGNNVIGWRIWKLQCHQWDGVDAVSHQDAPSATFGDHQQYWKDLCKSDSGRQTLHGLLHWFCQLRLCLDFWQTCNLHPRQIIHYDIQRWNIHAAACHGKSRFLNIQTCARCRPNFTDLCLRVTESPDEIFTALPRVTQMPKLCPRFYDRGLNLDKSFTSFGTSCKRSNWKTMRRVKSHQKSPQSKWNSRLSVWQFKLLPISVRFYDICEHLWNICEQKGDFGD